MTDCELSRKWREKASRFSCESTYKECANELDRWLLEKRKAAIVTQIWSQQTLAAHDAQIRAEAVAGALGKAAELATDGRMCTRADHMQDACMCIELKQDIRALTDKDAANWLAGEIAKARLAETEWIRERAVFTSVKDARDADERSVSIRAELERAEAELARGRG